MSESTDHELKHTPPVRRVIDKELGALHVIVKAMNDLDLDQSDRVICYLRHRFLIDEKACP